MEHPRDNAPVGMAVHARWGAMGGPSSVSDTGMAVKHLAVVELGLLNQLLEFRDLADLLEGENLVLLVTIDRETCGIVATVF